MKIILGDIYTLGIDTKDLKPNVSYQVKVEIKNNKDKVVWREYRAFTPIIKKPPQTN